MSAMPKKATLLLWSLAFVLAPPAFSCCIAPASPTVAMAEAEVVFAGTVIDRYDAASGAGLVSNLDPIVYTFQVASMWKGRLAKTLRVVSERDGMSGVAEVGSSYLVYASSDPDLDRSDETGLLSWGMLTAEDAAAGMVRAGYCSRTKPLDAAAEDLAALPPPLVSRDGGVRALASLPAALDALRQDDAKLRLAALNAIASLEEPLAALPPALERFLAGSEAEALTLVGVLERTALRDVSSVRWLARALGHRSAVVRRAAAEAIGKVARPDGEGILALAAGLGDLDYEVRRDCAHALGRFGPRAAPAVPALIRALDDDAAPVRHCAARALGAIGPEAREAVPALAWCMGVPDAPEGFDAAKALAAIGGMGLDSLYRALRGSDARARLLAATTLAGMKSTPPEAIPALKPLLTDEDMIVRLSAAQALARSEEEAEVAMALLISVLEHGSEHDRYLAASALSNVGPAGRAAEPALLSLLGGEDVALRVAAARAIDAIGSTGSEIATVVERLQESDGNPWVREWARKTLARLRSVSPK